MYCKNCLTMQAKKSGYCVNCSKHKVIETKFGSCFAYSGEFDADENPVAKSGQKIMAGIRKCGNSDCINRDHIILSIELERLNCYTLGSQSLADFWTALEKERF